MRYSFCTLFVDDDDRIHTAPHPDFANRTLRCAHFAVERDGRRHTGWIHEDYWLVPFDAEARPPGLLRVRMALADHAPLVDRDPARTAITGLQLLRRLEWRPDATLRDRLLAAL